MDAHLAPLAAIFDLNTDLLLNILDDLSEDESHQRLAGGGNSIAFLAAHLTDSRHYLASRLGHPLPNALARYLADAKSIDEIRSWATLEQVRAAWISVSTHLQTALDGLTAEDLARSGLHRFPVPDTTALGLITFLAQHDSYHLGQAAFVRRQLGKPAMTYMRRSKARTPAGAA
ncbi:MAG TPA: DinB family protein [Gemmatimonadales bacterium]|nr:DinB family protein [Gemmatimonadales bacterium]